MVHQVGQEPFRSYSGFDPNPCGEPTHKTTKDLQSSVNFHIFRIRSSASYLLGRSYDDSAGFLFFESRSSAA